MLVQRNEGKPRAKQPNNARPQGQKGGKKQTGKDVTSDTAKGDDVQKSAPSNDDDAEGPVDVEMGGSDSPISQGQRGNKDAGKSNTVGGDKTGNKTGDTAALGVISSPQSDHQTVENRAPTAQDTDMEILAGAMSSLRFVPRNVRLSSKKSGLPPR